MDNIEFILTNLQQEYPLDDVIINYMRAKYWYDFHAEDKVGMDQGTVKDLHEAKTAYEQAEIDECVRTWVNGALAILRYF